jgi:hypothetical protein
MDIKLILKLAKVSEATYDNPDKAKIKFKALGYDIVKYFENNGAEAYIIKNSEETPSPPLPPAPIILPKLINLIPCQK